MKKLGTLIVFALSMNLMHAQEQEKSVVFEKYNAKPIESVYNEQGGKIDRETKVLRVNHNEYFQSEATDANEIALSYLQAKQE